MMRRAIALLFVIALGVDAKTLRVDSLSALDIVAGKGDVVTWKGRRAFHALDTTAGSNGEAFVILRRSDFHDGTIEADIAGTPRTGASEGARGFVGLAFRVKDADHYECFYIRPTNGRCDDQTRRNHSTQYISAPDWPWQRLRKESPGVYESYADMEPAKWTHVKIVVSGTHAELYLNGAQQPSLLVNDLKLGDGSGAIALWIGSETEAYFSNVTVK
jgi:hypothetical protein